MRRLRVSPLRVSTSIHTLRRVSAGTSSSVASWRRISKACLLSRERAMIYYLLTNLPEGPEAEYEMASTLRLLVEGVNKFLMVNFF